MKRQINAQELQALYGSMGEAVWHIQYLEHTLVHYLVIRDHKHNPATEAEVYDRLERKQKSLLGQLFQEARRLGIIPPSLQPRFEKLIGERNWLVHRSRHECGSHLYDDELRNEMIIRISMIVEEAVGIQKIIFAELGNYMSSQGFDVKQAEQMGREELRRLVEQ